MKKKVMPLLLGVALSGAIIAFAEVTPGQKPSSGTEMSQMRDEINRLKAKIELLDYRTKSLESTVEQLKRSRPPAPLTLQGPAPSLAIPPVGTPKPPAIWGQGEVNGWTYYIVPCGEQSR